ncbi:hypothetical protein D770_21875 [Flammeovirgaceae bacterium 311]|nr:hypothetical protein D770_21875 [Flammeovirgaceae bacterium 311]
MLQQVYVKIDSPTIPMDLYRKSAITVGILFLAALILNLIASGMLNPILDNSEYLHHAYPNKDKIILANLLNFICAIAMIFIPIALFPVVKERFKSLASAYIVFRALEGVLFIYLAIQTLSFISLSRAFIQADSLSIAALQAIGESVQAEIYWATVIYIIVFSLGGATFYYLLCKSKLVPRLLSIWGFLAIALLLVGAILAIFGLGLFNHMPLMKGMSFFAPPIALNELVLGIWLIAKAYNTRVVPPSHLQKI